MKTSKLLYIVLILLSSGNHFLLNAQISVIVSKASVNTVTKTDVKNIFLGARLSWANGEKITVVDQSGSTIGSVFYSAFLEKSVNQIRVQWTKLVLSGQATAPIKATTDDEVKKAVAGSVNAIGYISTQSLDKSVKEVYRIEEEK